MRRAGLSVPGPGAAMVMRRLRRWLSAEAAPPPPPAPELAVLMVCMGNICRSPTAEAVLRARLAAASLSARVIVDSAGTHGYHSGEPPDARAIRHAAARGYRLEHLRARPVQPADFERFDLLLAMDEANLAWLNKRAPAGAAGRISLLLSHAPGALAREVPDPYYGPAGGFEQVLDLVEAACDGLVRQLQTRLSPGSSPTDS